MSLFSDLTAPVRLAWTLGRQQLNSGGVVEAVLSEFGMPAKIVIEVGSPGRSSGMKLCGISKT